LLTIRDLCNQFLANRKGNIASGELTSVSFPDDYATCARIVKAFGVARAMADLGARDLERFRASIE